jgi:hypothetical protein
MSYIYNKQANVREAEIVIAYLEKELGNTEEDMARIQQEVFACVSRMRARMGLCGCGSVCALCVYFCVWVGVGVGVAV